MFDRCWLWRRKLVRRTDGTLPARQCGALEDHLSQCPRCRAAAEADQALREVLWTHTGLLDARVAHAFDDLVVMRVATHRGASTSARRHAALSAPHSGNYPFAFLSQLLGGALGAAAITAVCLVPALHPAESAGRMEQHQAQNDFQVSAPPVPLESLLQTTAPCAALLWATQGMRADGAENTLGAGRQSLWTQHAQPSGGKPQRPEHRDRNPLG